MSAEYALKSLIFAGIFVTFALTSQSTSGSSSIPSYNCTDEERLFQFNNFELVGIHICDTSTIWRLAQLALLDAKTFLDVGGNLGYTAAHMFELWSPGHGFNRMALKYAIREAIRLNLTTNHEQVTTHCRDGKSVDQPMQCVGQPIESYSCQFRRDISVYSFDGQLEHVENQRKVIYSYFPHLHPSYTYNTSHTSVRGKWEYIHAALTNEVPFEGATGKFLENKHELGALVKEGEGNYEAKQLKPVPLLTIDTFCAQEGLSTVDVLKVDTEGHDRLVLAGADVTLRERGVKFIVVECLDCALPMWSKFYQTLDEKYGFDCYLYGVNNIALRMTNCWNYHAEIKRPPCTPNKKCPIYMRYYGRNFGRRALDSNAYCIHRSRAPALLQLVDNLGLYHYARDKRGHFHLDGLLGAKAVGGGEKAPREGKWSWASEKAGANYAAMFGRDEETGEKTFWKKFEEN